MGKIDKKFVLDLLKKIETKIIKIKPLDNPHEIYAGDVRYQLDNGYILVVFDDCDSWDYLDSIITPQGKIIDFWDYDYDNYDEKTYEKYQKEWKDVQNYRPPEKIATKIYGIGNDSG